ncbi:MAG: oligosaccharide flippase family protein [Clostridia bacterium]|nr:oligosaccharide flippase family protein [Clostridia bacterium]
MENIKKRLALRLPARASLWYILSGAAARGVGMLGTPIFTRLLTTEQYGLYPLFTTWMGLFSVVLTLELTGGVILRGLQRYEGRRDEFLSGALGLILTVCFVGAVLYFAFFEEINRITGLDTLTSTLLILNIILNAISSLYSARCRFEYKYKRVALINLLSAVGMPTVAVGLILLTPLREEARIIAAVLIGAATSLPLLVGFIRRSHRLISLRVWGYLLRINLPLLPHYLSVAVILRVGELTVGRVFGQAALGKYSVAVSLGMSLTMITGGLLGAIGPWVLRKIRQTDFAAIRNLVSVTTRGLCLICLLLLCVLPETIRIFTPRQYHDVLVAVYPLVLTVIPMFLSGVISSAEMYYERSFLASLPSVAAALLCTSLSLWLLPSLDYRTAGIFVLASYVIMTALGFLVFRRMSGNWIIEPKGVLISFALTALYAIVILLLRERVAARAVLIIPLIPMLIFCALDLKRKIHEPDTLPKIDEAGDG